MNPKIVLKTGSAGDVVGATVDGVVRVRLPEAGVFHVRREDDGNIEVYIATGVKYDVITLSERL